MILNLFGGQLNLCRPTKQIQFDFTDERFNQFINSPPRPQLHTTTSVLKKSYFLTTENMNTFILLA
jgi:hypothetical protein